jgi:hypothetical protein
MYRAYRKSIKKGSIYDVPESVYTNIISDLNEAFVEALQNGDIQEHRLGAFIGSFRMVKYKVPLDEKHMRIDWKTSIELGKRIYFENRHSKGYYAKMRWVKPTVFNNKSCFGFRPLKRHNKNISQLLIAGKVDFPVGDLT